MSDDEFTTKAGLRMRSLLDRFTATERFPLGRTVARREYRGIEFVVTAEVAYADRPPGDPGMKRRTIGCVAVTDDDQTIASETSTMTVGEAPRWRGLFGGDYRHVPSTSTHALSVIEPVREAVDTGLVLEEFDSPDLAAALEVELGELSARRTQSSASSGDTHE
jgi:hypothetical protein